MMMSDLIELVEANYADISIGDETLPDFIVQGTEKAAVLLLKQAEVYRTAAKSLRAAGKRHSASEAAYNAKTINRIAWLLRNGRIKNAWDTVTELDRGTRRELPSKAWEFMKRWGS